MTGGAMIGERVQAVNVGLRSFIEPLRLHGASAVQVDWQPPFGGEPSTARLLAELADDVEGTIGGLVRQANATATQRLLRARPVLIDVRTARDVLVSVSDALDGAPAGTPLGERTILHAGPPIVWDRMCGPMRGAILGAIEFEGWADTANEAEKLASRGAITFAPCHHYAAVGPMAGIISPSMPVWVVENEAFGNRTYSNLNEGPGKVLRFGANTPEVQERLHWMADLFAPTLKRAIERTGPIDLKAILAQALQMGDEGHNRNTAATALFSRALAAALARLGPADAAGASLEFLHSNIHFFVNLSMAACKASLDPARGLRGSTLVTVMARNGVEFGIQVSGTGNRWFTAPAVIIDALYFPGYGPADANPDIGDSAITETAGIGAFAMAAAPAIVRTVGGTAADALRFSQEMATITLTRNADYGLPSLDFSGSPTGIDLRLVVETRTAPVINSGVAHRHPGIGQIGAGIVRAPLSCFVDALRAVGDDLLASEA